MAWRNFINADVQAEKPHGTQYYLKVKCLHTAIERCWSCCLINLSK